MRNASNALYNDGLRPTATSNKTCANDQGPMWSYCQGLPIGYDVELHKLTGDPQYLTDALTIFAGVRSTLTAPASWPVPPPSIIMAGFSPVSQYLLESALAARGAQTWC